MARETLYVVQPFDRDADGALIAGTPIPAKSAAEARMAAARVRNQHAGVIAFSRTGDIDLGEYDDAEIIVAFGDVPDEGAFKD